VFARQIEKAASLQEGSYSHKLKLPVTLSQALYVPPVPSGEGRMCNNCMMWVKGEGVCEIHKRGQKIDRQKVCSYHVYGTPKAKWMDAGVKQPLTPKLSGLIDAPEGGTKCGNCRYYENDRCHRVATDKDKTVSASVKANGCCALWEG
jgi:hypothetical protein